MLNYILKLPLRYILLWLYNYHWQRVLCKHNEYKQNTKSLAFHRIGHNSNSVVGSRKLFIPTRRIRRPCVGPSVNSVRIILS